MSETILVVEDDPMITEMVDIVLSQAGYAVVVAGTAEAALELLGRTRFSLVLLDYQMPRMSGLDMMTVLKRRAKAIPPVVMVTADRNIATVREAMQLGCVGYVAKPFTPELLRTRVKAALAGTAPAGRQVVDV